MIIYGRYTDVVVPPLLALALVRSARERRFGSIAVLIAIAVTTVATALLRAGECIRPDLRTAGNVASLPAPTFQLVAEGASRGGLSSPWLRSSPSRSSGAQPGSDRAARPAPVSADDSGRRAQSPC